MVNREPEVPTESWTDSHGTILYIVDGPGDTTPRKVDPSTIQWPEGVPKPWEQPEPPQEPPADKD